jgi:serine/arginine repetitive matrix protein 2
MTPRDAGFESDDQSSSTTPRATSPRLPGVSGSVIIPPSSVHGRKDSNASTVKQPSRTATPLASAAGSGTPLFFSRTLNGRFTPEDRYTGDAVESDRDRQGSRRRPISPLSGQAYQPIGMASSSPTPASTSRPGTPSSNSTWHQTQNQSAYSRPTHVRNGSGRSRNGSVSSLTDIASSDMHGYGVTMDSAFQRSRFSETARPARSPALPDSPLIDNGHEGYSSFAAAQSQLLEQNRSPSVMSGFDLSSPFSFSRSLRSPTPNDTGGYITQGHSHAPNGTATSRAKSPTFSENGVEKTVIVNGTAATGNSKSSPKRHQKTESSMAGFTLSLGSSQPLVLSPFVNSSRSSLESEGSSYHSWDEEAGGRPKDRVKAMFAKVEAEPSEWHQLAADESVNSGFGSFGKEEVIVRQLSGLSKVEFASIQEKLIDVVTSKSYEGGRERADRAGSALRKRRPSTSQSNYSVAGKESRVRHFWPIFGIRLLMVFGF